MRRLTLIILGGAVLAAIAGFVNTVFIARGFMPVTHLTGSVSQIGGDLLEGRHHHGVTLGRVTLGFIAGAALSGMIIGSDTLRIGKPYGRVMLIEAGVLIAAALTLPSHAPAALPLAAFAAGMQNAMASSYGHLVLRTTHVTGIATDLGLLIGHLLRGDPVEKWKLTMLVALLVSFFLGGVAGWGAQRQFGAYALLLPASVLILIGSVYMAWRVRLRE